MVKIVMKIAVVLMVVTCGLLFGETRAMAVAVPSFHAMQAYEPQSNEDNDLEPNSGVDFTRNPLKNWVEISLAPPATANRVDGAPLELECEASGSPPPNIHWLRDGKPVSQYEEYDNNNVIEGGLGSAKVRSRLIINNILPEDNHSYTCVATAGPRRVFAKTHVHSTHRSLPKPTNLNEYLLLNREILSSPSKPRIVLFYSIAIQEMGTTLVLPCKVVGHPKPDFYWLDNDDNLISDQNPRIKVLRSGELVIEGLTWPDMGAYTCVARNSIAKDSITTFVYPVLNSK